jgi:hypothetical protein
MAKKQRKEGADAVAERRRARRKRRRRWKMLRMAAEPREDESSTDEEEEEEKGELDVADILPPDLLAICAQVTSSFARASVLLNEDEGNGGSWLPRFRRWSNQQEEKQQEVVWLHSGAQEECDRVRERVVQHRYRSVLVVAGPSVTSIAHGFLSNCCRLERVDFICPWVREIGNNCLTLCTALVHFGARHGLGALERAGDGWLKHCVNLTEADFSGLETLQTVGYGWMLDCHRLKEVRVPPALRRVGNHWLGSCISLEKVDLQKNQLRSVGDYWMADCPKMKF